ncbi:MAG: maleylacetoacetate isomerase [Pseudomonadales bacterium]|jgi:maleylacetoacetate isomerase|nr:maleylacetoacetate isomerase [Pseudomonadales bacterium]
MITLYTYWRSSAAFRVRIALNLKGIDYEPRFVNLVRDGGEQNQPAYREINPQGRVPTLVHDGHVITQSMAILEHLEGAFPNPRLLPADAFDRAYVRSLAQTIVSDVQPLQNTSVTQYLTGQLHLHEQQLAEWLRVWITRGLAAFEAKLVAAGNTGRYCHGDQPTLADCCLYPQVASARRFGVDPAAFATIMRVTAACDRSDAFVRASPENQPDRA